MPLKPEYLEPTLRALRSSEYKQHTGTIGIFGTKTLCCIGVSADANGFKPVNSEDDGNWGYPNNFTTENAAKYIGLTKEEMQQWIEWNDELELPFPIIAGYVAEAEREEYYKGDGGASERST